MYISKYWGDFIGGSDDSLSLVEFLDGLNKEEITLKEIFTGIGLDRQNIDFRQTVENLRFINSIGLEIDFHRNRKRIYSYKRCFGRFCKKSEVI